MSSNSYLRTSSSSGSTQRSVEIVTTPKESYSNLLAYIGGSNEFEEVWFDTNSGTGGTGVSYPLTLGGNPADIELSATYTHMHVIDNAGTELQNVNLSTGVVDSSFAITGMLASRAVRSISINPATGELWAYAAIGGSAEVYIIDVTTGVATLVGAMPVLQNNAGFAFAPDGRLFIGEDPGTTSYVRELVFVLDSSGTPIFNKGEALIFMGDTGAAFRGPMAFTARGTILSNAISTNTIQEFDFSGAPVNASNVGNINSGGSIAYYNPFRSRMLYVGSPIRMVTELDAGGAVVGTRYFTNDDQEQTLLTTTDIVPLPEKIVEPVEAIHTSETILGTSLTTSYQDLIAELQNSNGSVKILQVYNGTDRNVFLQFTNQGSSVDQIFIPQGGATTIDYGASGRVASGNLRVRAIDSAATTGSIHALLVR